MIGRPLANSFKYLGEKIIIPIKQYFVPRQFTFITLPPQQNFNFKSFPVEDWRIKKQEYEEIDKIRIASIFIIFFFIGDWVYTMKNNENVMYYYYVNYPLAMKLLETNIYQVEKAFKPFIEITPKEKYQIPQVWDRIWNAIFNTHETQKIKDENIQKLKTQLAQIDKKLI